MPQNTVTSRTVTQLSMQCNVLSCHPLTYSWGRLFESFCPQFQGAENFLFTKLLRKLCHLFQAVRWIHKKKISKWAIFQERICLPVKWLLMLMQRRVWSVQVSVGKGWRTAWDWMPLHVCRYRHCRLYFLSKWTALLWVVLLRFLCTVNSVACSACLFRNKSTVHI